MRAQLLVLLAACLLAAYSNPTHAKSYEEQVQDDQNSVMDHFTGGGGRDDDHHEHEREHDDDDDDDHGGDDDGGSDDDNDDDDDDKKKPPKDMQKLLDECKDAAVDMVMVVDHSASIDVNGGEGTFDRVIKPFLWNTVSTLNLKKDKSRLAMVRFSTWDKTSVDWDLEKSATMHEKEILHEVQKLSYSRGDWTQTPKALKLVRDKILPQRDPKRTLLVIVVTDGRPQFPPSHGQPDLRTYNKGDKGFARILEEIREVSAEINKEANVAMFPVAVNMNMIKNGKLWARDVMIAMTSSQTWSDVIMASDFKTLMKKVTDIQKKMCKTIECQKKTVVTKECDFKNNAFITKIIQKQYSMAADACVDGKLKKYSVPCKKNSRTVEGKCDDKRPELHAYYQLNTIHTRKLWPTDDDRKCVCEERAEKELDEIRCKCFDQETIKGDCKNGKRLVTVIAYGPDGSRCKAFKESGEQQDDCPPVPCPEDERETGKCKNGERTITITTYKRKDHFSCTKKVTKEVTKEGCSVPCDLKYRKMIKQGDCEQKTGKAGQYHRKISVEINFRPGGDLTKCEKKIIQEWKDCKVPPCPKPETKKTDCKGKSHVYVTDEIIYYGRDRTGQCVKRHRTEERYCCNRKGGCRKTKCICSAVGDPHYRLYDGSVFHFYGPCMYILSQFVNVKDECAFRIMGKNRYRGTSKMTWLDFIRIEMFGHTFQLGQQRELRIDGLLATAPFQSERGDAKIFYSGNFIQFLSKRCGVNVIFDGSATAGIMVGAQYESRMNGICGNCDGKKNDYVDAAGVDMSRKTTKFSIIGNSYRVKDATDARYKSCKDHIPEPCAPIDKRKAEELCAEIKNKRGIFMRCLASLKVDFAMYYDACVIDVCSNSASQTLALEARCSAFQGMNEACSEIGIPEDWRSPDLCPPSCPDDKPIYDPQGPACAETCESFFFGGVKRCFDQPKREQCRCAKGYVLDGDKCVRPNDCECLRCADNAGHKNCLKWKAEGRCKNDNDRLGMLKQCKRSCEYCTPRPVCEDYISAEVCRKRKALGKCSEDFYKHFCGLTCNWKNCPCQQSHEVRGECDKNQIRNVKVLSYFRDPESLKCFQKMKVRQESCGTCESKSTVKKGNCDYCENKRLIITTTKIKKGLGCFISRKKTYEKCDDCKYANNQTKMLIRETCQAPVIISIYKRKKQNGCHKCEEVDHIETKTVVCKKPWVEKPKGKCPKGRKWTIKKCKEKQSNCKCVKKCVSEEEFCSCQEDKAVGQDCIVFDKKKSVAKENAEANFGEWPMYQHLLHEASRDSLQQKVQ